MKKQVISFLLILSISTCLLAQDNLKAEYFNGTNFQEYVGTNYVSNLDFYWNQNPPIEGLNPNKCSVRYTGQLRTPKTGSYLFSARVDDGIRVWIDDKLIITNWQLNDVGFAEGKIELEADTDYYIKIEYFNALREAELRLLWEIPEEDSSFSWLTSWWDSKPAVIKTDYFLPFIERPSKEQALAVFEAKPIEKIKEQPIPKVVEKPVAKVIEKPVTKIKEKPAPIVNAKPVEQLVEKPLLQSTPTPKPVVETTPAVLSQTNKTPEALLQYIPKNVEFERAKAEILSVSYADLNKLASFLVNNPNRKVKIEGHTDNVGDSDKNLILSEERATAIKSYFLNNGVRDNQIISAIGYGGSKPIVKSDGIKHNPENRRVEFILK